MWFNYLMRTLRCNSYSLFYKSQLFSAILSTSKRENLMPDKVEIKTESLYWISFRRVYVIHFSFNMQLLVDDITLTLSAFKLSTIFRYSIPHDGQYNNKYFFKTKLNTKVAVLCQCTLLNMTIFIFSVSTDNECSQILSQKMTSTSQFFIAVKTLKQEIGIRTR